MPDHLAAIRFARKDDAAKTLATHPEARAWVYSDDPPRITHHMWCGSVACTDNIEGQGAPATPEGPYTREWVANAPFQDVADLLNRLSAAAPRARDWRSDATAMSVYDRVRGVLERAYNNAGWSFHDAERKAVDDVESLAGCVAHVLARHAAEERVIFSNEELCRLWRGELVDAGGDRWKLCTNCLCPVRVTGWFAGWHLCSLDAEIPAAHAKLHAWRQQDKASRVPVSPTEEQKNG